MNCRDVNAIDLKTQVERAQAIVQGRYLEAQGRHGKPMAEGKERMTVNHLGGF